MDAGELRPCIVEGAKALFHMWVDVDQPISRGNIHLGTFRMIAAIVEIQNGDVELVSPASIRFLDSDDVFAQYNWPSEEG